MDSEHKPKKSGKRKDRGACAHDFTMRRELKALDESSLPKLPPIRVKPKERKALDLALHAQASSVLPPIKGCCPPPAQAMKGDLHMEHLEKTPELEIDLPGESIFVRHFDERFKARLSGNETPELKGSKEFLVTPVQDGQSQVQKLSSASVSKAQSNPILDDSLDNTFPVSQSNSSAEVEEGNTCEDSSDSQLLTVSPIVIKEAAEVVVKELESSFNVGFPLYFLYNRLMNDLMEELELLVGIKVTCQVLGGRLFPDENSAISRIVREACESLSDGRWVRRKSCVDRWTVGYIADAVLKAFVNYALECIQSRSSSPDTDAVQRSLGLGLPEVQEDPYDTSAPQSEQHSRINVSETKIENSVPRNRSARSCSTVLSELSASEIEELIREIGGSANSDISESAREDSPDLSSFTPAVQVTEAPEDSMENVEELEIPVCPNGTTASRPKNKRRLLSRVSKFLRRVFCFGCIRSQPVKPL